MKILLVEDDKFFQKFYSLKLTEAGYEVGTASNGDEALASIKTSMPALILLDLVMPIKDGFEFLVERTKEPTIAAVPVIVFSTLGQEEDVKRARSLGANDYINKSFFDFENLRMKIESLLHTLPTSR